MIMKKTKSDLFELPNIGIKSVAQMKAVGIKTIKQFQKIGPEKTYEKCCKLQKTNINRAFLYVLRAAHFYTYNKDKREQSLLWWFFRKPGEGGKSFKGKRSRSVRY
jgi:hypothetical protein